MNKEEILKYLLEKRRLTAPVASAEEKLRHCKCRLEKAENKWIKGIIALGIAFLFFFLYLLIGKDLNLFYFDRNGSPQLGGLGGSILFGGILGLVLYKKHIRYVVPAEQEVAEAQTVLQQEKGNSNYQSGETGFPKKFYNYSDIYRLWSFINEGRAETLKEAYNLLETQQFQQNQMAIQQEIKSLQQDMAASARVAAVASTVSAYNTTKVSNKISKVIR